MVHVNVLSDVWCNLISSCDLVSSGDEFLLAEVWMEIRQRCFLKNHHHYFGHSLMKFSPLTNVCHITAVSVWLLSLSSLLPRWRQTDERFFPFVSHSLLHSEFRGKQEVHDRLETKTSVCVCEGRKRRGGKAVVSSFNFINCWLAAINRERGR